VVGNKSPSLSEPIEGCRKEKPPAASNKIPKGISPFGILLDAAGISSL
jgi:hypothetical protein